MDAAASHLRRRHPYFACTLPQQEWLSRDPEYLQTADGQPAPLTVPLMDMPFHASKPLRHLNPWDQVRAVAVDSNGRFYQTHHYLHDTFDLLEMESQNGEYSPFYL